MTNDMVRVVLGIVGFERVRADFVWKVLPFPPCGKGIPVLGPHIEGEDALFVFATLDPTEAAPARRVFVLRVGFMVGKVLIDRRAAFFPLGFINGIYPYPGVDRLAPRVHKQGDREVRLLEDGKLLVFGLLVELDQDMAVAGHSVVRTRIVVLGKRVDANPCPLLGLGKMLALLGIWAEELGQPLGSGNEDALGRWEPFAVLGLPSLIGNADNILVLEAVEQDIGGVVGRLRVNHFGHHGGVEYEATIGPHLAFLASVEPTLGLLMGLDEGIVEFMAEFLLAPRRRTMGLVPLVEQEPCVIVAKVKAVGQDAGGSVGGGVTALACEGGWKFGKVSPGSSDAILEGHLFLLSDVFMGIANPIFVSHFMAIFFCFSFHIIVVSGFFILAGRLPQ